MDPELTRKAAASGLIGVFLGMESFNSANLKSVRKGFNKVHQYKQAIDNLHRHGIMAGAGLLFGFDHDDPSVFETSIRAAAEIGLDGLNIAIVTPFPGTALHDRIVSEGRLLTRDWSRYQPTKHVVYKPKILTPEELLKGHHWAVDEFYKPWPVIKRIARAPWRAKAFTWFVNWHYNKVKNIQDWHEAPGQIEEPVESDVEPMDRPLEIAG